ncbi:MAG: hypothetical protein M1831_003311 [Alyxoria varia]|nr:MAG: hypothetical protein M1831_003311 [Alyxoria varia]
MIPRFSLPLLGAFLCVLVALLASADNLDQIIQKRQGVALGTGSSEDTTPSNTPSPSATPTPTEDSASSPTPSPSDDEDSTSLPPFPEVTSSADSPNGPSSSPDRPSPSNSAPTEPQPQGSSSDSSDSSTEGSDEPSASPGESSDTATTTDDSSPTSGGGSGGSRSGPTGSPRGPNLVITSTDRSGSVMTLSGAEASSALTRKVTFTSPLVSRQTSNVIRTIVGTRSNGESYTSTTSSQEVLAKTTGFATVTSTPSLNNGDGEGSSNLSDNSKKVIGGVVGGIGGAIVLGALAFVAWRIWGRKKPTPEEDDLMSDQQYATGQASLTQEKRASRDGSTTLSDGLERYRDPAHPSHNVNTSSNF